jgi:hypothetical protein
LVWTVVFHPDAESELGQLPATERAAMVHAIEKLEALGPRLPFPHQSSVRGHAASLRELRSRAGRSRWRGFYDRRGGIFVLAAIGPEAQVDRRGFDRAVAAALGRLDEIET